MSIFPSNDRPDLEFGRSLRQPGINRTVASLLCRLRSVLAGSIERPVNSVQESIGRVPLTYQSRRAQACIPSRDLRSSAAPLIKPAATACKRSRVIRRTTQRPLGRGFQQMLKNLFIGHEFPEGL